MPQVYGGFECHEQVDKGPFHEVWRATAAGEAPPGSCQVRIIRHPGGSLPGPPEWEETCRRQLARWEVQQRAAAADPQCFASVHPPSPDRHESGVFLVTDYFPLDLARVITGAFVIESLHLHTIVSRIYAAMMSIERNLGRPHGRINAESVLLDTTRISTKSRVVLAEPESDDEIVPEAARSRDIRALGELIYCLTTRERHAPERGSPPPDIAPFERYRRHARRWHALCTEMLDVTPAIDLDELRRMRYPQRFPKPDDQSALQFIGAAAAIAAVFIGTWVYNSSQVAAPIAGPLIEPLTGILSTDDLEKLECRDCPLDELSQTVSTILETYGRDARESAETHMTSLEGWREGEVGRTRVRDFDVAVTQIEAMLKPPQSPDAATASTGAGISIDEQALAEAGAAYAAALAGLKTYNSTATSVAADLRSLQSGALSLKSLLNNLGGTDAKILVEGEERELSDVVEVWYSILTVPPKAQEAASASEFISGIRPALTAAGRSLTSISSDFNANQQENYLLDGRNFTQAEVTARSADYIADYWNNLSAQKLEEANQLRGLARSMESSDQRVQGLIERLRGLDGLSPDAQAAVTGNIAQLEAYNWPSSPEDLKEDLWSKASLDERRQLRETALAVKAEIDQRNTQITTIEGGIDGLRLDPDKDPRKTLAIRLGTLRTRIGAQPGDGSFEVPPRDGVDARDHADYDQAVAGLREEQAATRMDLTSYEPLLDTGNPAWTVGNEPAIRERISKIPEQLLAHSKSLDVIEADILNRFAKPDPARMRETLLASVGPDTGDVFQPLQAKVRQRIQRASRLSEEALIEELQSIDKLWSTIVLLRQAYESLEQADGLDAESFDEFARLWIDSLVDGFDFIDEEKYGLLQDYFVKLTGVSRELKQVHSYIVRLTPLEQDIEVRVEDGTQSIPLRSLVVDTFESFESAVVERPFGRGQVFSEGEQISALRRFVEQVRAWDDSVAVNASSLTLWQAQGRRSAWEFARERFDESSGDWTDYLRWYAYVDGFLAFEQQFERRVDLDLDELEVDRQMYDFADRLAQRNQMSDRIPENLHATRVSDYVTQNWSGIARVRSSLGVQTSSTSEMLRQAGDESLNDGRRVGFVLLAVDEFADEIEAMTAVGQEPEREQVDRFAESVAAVRDSVDPVWRSYIGDQQRGIIHALEVIRPSGAVRKGGPDESAWKRSTEPGGVIRFVPTGNIGGIAADAAAIEFLEVPEGRIYLQRTELSLGQFMAILASAPDSQYREFIASQVRCPDEDASPSELARLIDWGDFEEVRGYFLYSAGSSDYELVPALTWVRPTRGVIDRTDDVDWTSVNGWVDHINHIYAPSLDARWWGESGKGRWPGTAGLNQPLHNVSFAGASAIAEAIGCRLPTPEEWGYALDQYQASVSGIMDVASRWNTSDQTWKSQQDFADGSPAIERPQPYAGSFINRAVGASLPPNQFAWPAGAAATNDGWLWLRPVGREPEDAGQPGFHDLVGNVAEWADQSAGSRTLDVLQDVMYQVNTSEAPVMGVSAMSGNAAPGASHTFDMIAPRRGRGAPRAVDLTTLFSDVGLRLTYDVLGARGTSAPGSRHVELRSAIEEVLSGPADQSPG